MKWRQLLSVFTLLLYAPFSWASPCPEGSSFEAPVTIEAKFPTLDIVSSLKGTYTSGCGNLRFDFLANDLSFPSDVSVIANGAQQKIYVVSHASKSYFVQPLTSASVGNLHELVTPFHQIFLEPSKRKWVGDLEVRGERCKDYAFESKEHQGNVCLSVKNPDRPLRIAAKLTDGSLLTQEIGPYHTRDFPLSQFHPPTGYKTEDYSVNELLTLFLNKPADSPGGLDLPLPSLSSPFLEDNTHLIKKMERFLESQQKGK